jgi:signal peptidase II
MNKLVTTQGHQGLWFGVAFTILVLDQITKYLAATWLVLHQPVPVIPMVNLTLMYNTGAAFSLFADAGGWQRWFFICFAGVIVIILVLWLWRLTRQEWLLALSLACILGGALGNVFDRVLLGYVIDFIDIYYQHWHWPAFNLADSAIVVGAGLLVLDAGLNQHPH